MYLKKIRKKYLSATIVILCKCKWIIYIVECLKYIGNNLLKVEVIKGIPYMRIIYDFRNFFTVNLGFDFRCERYMALQKVGAE